MIPNEDLVQAWECHVCNELGAVEAAAEALRLGANPNTCWESSPLASYATVFGKAAFLEVLLKAGACLGVDGSSVHRNPGSRPVAADWLMKAVSLWVFQAEQKPGVPAATESDRRRLQELTEVVETLVRHQARSDQPDAFLKKTPWEAFDERVEEFQHSSQCWVDPAVELFPRLCAALIQGSDSPAEAQEKRAHWKELLVVGPSWAALTLERRLQEALPEVGSLAKPRL